MFNTIPPELEKYVIRGSDGKPKSLINKHLIVQRNIQDEQLKRIVELHELKLEIYDSISSEEQKLNLYADKLTDVEYQLQDAWGFPRDRNYHRFWESCKSCPVMDNEDRHPHGPYIVNVSCPLHGGGL